MSDFATATVMEGAGDVRPVQHGDDSRFLVEFYTREIEDEKQTKIHGRRMLASKAYCRKRAMGDPRTVWDAPVSDEDKMRWPQQWAAYERGEHDMVFGTPLDSWPLLSREARLLMKNWGFKTVDQVAEVTDATLLGMEPSLGRTVAQVREHAKKFIEDQQSGESERRLAGELEKRDNEMGAMKNTIAQLSATIERMNAERLAAPIVKPQETGPGFQPMHPPQPAAEIQAAQGLKDLETLPELEPEAVSVVVAEPASLPEPESGPAPAPFSRKLSDGQIAEIRASEESNKALAAQYGVSVPTIARYRKA